MIEKQNAGRSMALMSHDQLQLELAELTHKHRILLKAVVKASPRRDEFGALLKEARGMLTQGDFSLGVCCCGEQMDTHGYMGGHGPVDAGSHAATDLTLRIDHALAGKPREDAVPGALVFLSDVASLQRYTLGGHCDSFGQDCGAEMELDDEGEYILLAEVLMLAGTAKAEATDA